MSFSIVPVENSGSVLARSDPENLFAVMKRSLIGDSAERECALQGVVAVLPARQARGADVSDRF
jgi:hypothetical protein